MADDDAAYDGAAALAQLNTTNPVVQRGAAQVLAKQRAERLRARQAEVDARRGEQVNNDIYTNHSSWDPTKWVVGSGQIKPDRVPTDKQREREEATKRSTAARKAVTKVVKEKVKEQFPTKSYGKMVTYVPRYTTAGQEFFGETARTADNNQLARRALYGFSGDGEYFRGNGMYVARNGATHMRPTDRFSGEGGFFDDIGNFFVKAGSTVLPIAKNLARAAVPIVGNAIAPGIGGAIGSHALNTFLGEGAYETDPMIVEEPPIKYNNLINSGSIQTKTTALIEPVGDETGDLIFTHNEYIRDLTSLSPDFHTLERFEINPGVFQSFPLLSQFAQHFEEYDFLQCIFEFKSLVTDGNSSAAGSVMMAPNYNASNPNLPDKRSIENASGSVSGKVTSSLFCGIECANDKTAYGGIKYVRTVEIDPAGRRMYDLGFLQIACQGVPSGFPIGELHCRYKVRLSKMKVGALKIPSLGSGFVISYNSDVRDGIKTGLFLGKMPDFNHQLTRPSRPSGPGVIVMAGDDISALSIATIAGQPRETRDIAASFAVVGGSQLTFTLTWTEYRIGTLPDPLDPYIFDGNTNDTDCTIPFNITTEMTSISVSTPEWMQSFDSHAIMRTMTATIVFGTPGQIGKMNLRVRVVGRVTDAIPPANWRTANWNAICVRTA